MASYIAAASGNFNTGSTWHLVDSTSLLDSEAGNTEITTDYATSRSQTFAPGAVECDGIAVKYASGAVDGYTVKCELYNSTDGVAVVGTEVTINTADLPDVTTTDNAGGWVFFKWASPVTLEAAHNYAVEVKESNAAANVYLYRDATALNWSRMLRTTTDAASPPAAASILHIMEEKTGAGAATTITVTMDAIAGAITDYGSGTADSAGLTISDGGTLNFGTTAATAYYLKLSGNLIVYNGGTLTIGTPGSEIPRDGSAILEFDPAADGDLGLIIRNNGTFTAQGLSRTAGNNTYYTTLDTDEAINSTELGLTDSTGWLDNDEIAIASTTRTASQSEKGALSADQGANDHIHVDGFAGAGGGLAAAHSGTSPIQAEVILLTRNVKVRSSASATMAYVYIQGAAAIVNIDWVEFYYIGENTAGQRGIESAVTSAANFDIRYSSIHDCEDQGMYLNNSADGTISYNVFYGCGTAGQNCMTFGSSCAFDFTYNISIGGGSSTLDWTTQIYYATNIDFSHNTIAGWGGSGYGYKSTGSSSFVGVPGTFTYNTFHSNAGGGACFTVSSGTMSYAGSTITIDNCIFWRNSGYGFYIGYSSSSWYYFGALTFSNCTFFGNSTSNIAIVGYIIYTTGVSFDNVISNGDNSFATTYGLTISWTASVTSHLVNWVFNNCNFSTVAGIKTAHTQDIYFNANFSYKYLSWKMNNCYLGAATEIDSISGAIDSSYIKSTYHDQSGTTHKSWFKYGTVESDAAVFNTATPSMKCTPNSASYKLESGSFKVNVQSGQLCTPSVYTRKSEAAEGDAADYNGNHQRLIVKRNDGIGITADTVIDTAAGAIGNPWEQLTGNTAVASANGVMEFVVDCDGTTGFINVDDFTATVT